MDRRKFLQTLTVIGASTAIPSYALASDHNTIVTPGAAPLPVGIERLFLTPDTENRFPRIGIVVIGGSGGVILSQLASQLPNLSRSIAIDTNPFALNRVMADHKILVGNGKRFLTDPNSALPLKKHIGQEISDAVTGLDFVFIIAGMGGVSGTHIAPIVADILHEKNIRAFGTIVTPFDFEGERRMRVAISGMRSLSQSISTILPISNEVLAQSVGDDADVMSVLNQSDTIFQHVFRNITNTAASNGLVGVDIDDAWTVLNKGGRCAFGFGSAQGVDGAAKAMKNAIASPLLGYSQLSSASGILVAIEGSRNTLKMSAINTALKTIKKFVSPEVQIIFSGQYSSPNDDLKISILATGLPHAWAQSIS